MTVKAKDRKHIDVYVLPKNHTEVPEPDYEPFDGFYDDYEYDPPEMEFELSEANFGEEYFVYDEVEGDPKYGKPQKIWDEFIQWLSIRLEQSDLKENEEMSYEREIGMQLVEFAGKRNAQDIYILMKRNWGEFRDTYLCVEGCPDIVMEFVRGIMYKKMTEKQMWGSEEDRMLEGTVIVFDQSLMPKEGEDTGKLRFECRPNYLEEMLQGRRKKK